MTPELPDEKSYTELCEILSNHFMPIKSVIAEWFNFYIRMQLTEESAAAYGRILKSRSLSCKFGQFLDQILLDQFVIGPRDPNVHVNY